MDDILIKHKAKWEGLAEENDRYYVRSVDHEQSDSEYAESGRACIQRFLLNDKTLCERLPDFSKLTILEIGCGSGRMTRTLAKEFEYVYAVDISANMLSKAKAFVASDNVEFYESTGTSVPVPLECLDLAYSYIVYQHFPSKDSVQESFSEVFRSLKPGGLFKVQIRGLEHPDTSSWSWGPHFTEKEAKHMCTQVGFEILNQQGAGLRSYWLLLLKPL